MRLDEGAREGGFAGAETTAPCTYLSTVVQGGGSGRVGVDDGARNGRSRRHGNDGSIQHKIQ